jgi:hypothetical protein
MTKENLPVTPPNTEPHPMHDEEDLAEELAEDLHEDSPLDEMDDEEADSSGLGPRG